MSEKLFLNCRFYILPDGLLQRRHQLFVRQILKYGGEVAVDISASPPTHILVEEDILASPTRLKNALKSVGILTQSAVSCHIVNLNWLSFCLKEKKLLSIDQYSIRDKTFLKNQAVEINCPTPVKKMMVDVIEKNTTFAISPTYRTNMLIIDEFQKLADVFKTRGDKWRSVAYERAVSSLKSYKKEITDSNELKTLPHMSAKMLDKVSEVLENGFSTKVENICNDEKTKVLEVFSKIWGAGPLTAQMWYQKGLRTLDDVKEKGNLTVSQKIGLKYYNEIRETIPRSEVKEIMNLVKDAALRLEPSVQLVPCGSFRRGQEVCGDVDILFILKDTINYRRLIPRIVCELKADGFLIDDLVGSISTLSAKYFGLFKLKKENSKVRRLDLFSVPEQSSACAIMHYTGSGLFNRGIRFHASKMNMQLSDSFLRSNGPNGKIIFTPSEESIFSSLGLQYRPPEERQVF